MGKKFKNYIFTRRSINIRLIFVSVNHLDIAPQHASVLMGISNTLANLPGIISPALTGFIVTNAVSSDLFSFINNLLFIFKFLDMTLFHLEQTVEEWRIVFRISSCIYLFGCIVNWFWCSGELQSWVKKSVVQINSKPNTTDGVSNVGYTNEGTEIHL